MINEMDEFAEGKKAYLIKPEKGYNAVTLIEQTGLKWLVETSSGMELEVYEDELEE
jgi:hypothetical protein